MVDLRRFVELGDEEFKKKFDKITTPAEFNNLFHTVDDRDVSALSSHHTLGLSPTQSSPGSHNHDGKNSRRLIVPRCKVRISADQTITDGTLTEVNWNQVDYDPDGLFNDANNEIIPKKVGLYMFVAQIRWNFSTGGSGRRAITINKNNVIVAQSDIFRSGTTVTVHEATAFEFADGVDDFFDVDVVHNSAASLAIDSAGSGCWFHALWLAPDITSKAT